MSDMYKPSGELQGDTKAMPDRGTGTGLNGDTYGADLSVDACNCTIENLGRATKSDPAFQKSTKDPK